MNPETGKVVIGTLIGKPEYLNSEARVRDALLKITEKTSMKLIDGPHLVRVTAEPSALQTDPEADSGGVTGSCVWSTSGAMIHTWPELCRAEYVIHSCKRFNIETVRFILETAFFATEMSIHDVSWVLTAQSRPMRTHLTDTERLQDYRELLASIYAWLDTELGPDHRFATEIRETLAR